jgi:hypothetical protein
VATANLPAVQNSLVLDAVDWRMYTGLLRVLAERRGLRLTYDRGTLEIMSPSFAHEIDADLLGRFVVALTEEIGLPIQAGRSTTLRRRRKRRGLEPDHCWWIANAPRMQGRRKLDLRVDPPPDLAVEIDVTAPSTAWAFTPPWECPRSGASPPDRSPSNCCRWMGRTRLGKAVRSLA